MKRILKIFSLMFIVLVSTVSVLAVSYVNVRDDQGYMQDASNYATATLSGRREEVSGKLSNVNISKTQKGQVTCTAKVTERKAYSAKGSATFYYKGKKRSTAYLYL